MWFKKAANEKTILYLTGGLGNQLFQFAALLNYAFESGSTYRIDIKSGSPRINSNGYPEIFSYDLDKNSVINYPDRWNRLTTKVFSLNLRLGLVENSKITLYITKILIRRIASLWTYFIFHQHFSVWVSPDLGYSRIPKSKKPKYLIGYFQSYRYVETPSVMKMMRSLKLATLSMDVRKYEELAQVEKPLVVHVRLQDYRNEVNFGILSSNYYEKSIQAQMNLGLHKKIWLFSDDIEGAKILIPRRFHSIIEWIGEIDGSTASTLEVMRLGFGYVIGNSSFSWWGAMLSHNSNSLVIAPTPWFTGMEEPCELAPKSWTRLPR